MNYILTKSLAKMHWFWKFFPDRIFGSRMQKFSSLYAALESLGTTTPLSTFQLSPMLSLRGNDKKDSILKEDNSFIKWISIFINWQILNGLETTMLDEKTKNTHNCICFRPSLSKLVLIRTVIWRYIEPLWIYCRCYLTYSIDSTCWCLDLLWHVWNDYCFVACFKRHCQVTFVEHFSQQISFRSLSLKVGRSCSATIPV